MPGDPEDRDERGEQQQLVGDGIEQLPELAHLLIAAREISVARMVLRGSTISCSNSIAKV